MALVSSHRSKGMKVKVTLGDIGLVIPVSNDGAKVEQLTKDIALRFESYGIKPGELRIAQLSTVDGYLINQNDSIKDVVDDGDRLVALDYEDWMQKELQYCNTQWGKVIREDFADEDSKYKWIIVGQHDHNKLFVKFGTQWPTGKSAKVTRLELYDCESLQHFAKEGKVLLASQEGEGGKWKQEAHFIISKGSVEAVELSVKAMSDRAPVVKRIGVKVGRKLEKGVKTTVHSDVDDYDPAIYKIPPAQKAGPVISGEGPKTEVSKDAKSTGNSTLQVTQKGDVQVEQSYPRDGVWYNAFMSNFSIINNAKDLIAITKVTSEYKTKDNKWVPCDETVFGYRSGFHNHHWDWDTTHFNMDGLEQRDLAIRSAIKLNAPQYERERRAHKSLPQPMTVRITFEENNGKKTTIEVHQQNPALELTTKEKRSQNRSEEPKVQAFYTQCDDTEFETRLFAEAYFNDKERRVELYNCDNNKSKWVNIGDLKRFAYNAVQQNKEEVEIEDLTWKHELGLNSTVFALVDLKNHRTYGFKFVLKTTTSSVTENFVIPKFSPKEKKQK